ncbi:MAG: hypothetical protein HYX69_06885 [Planctomycetia bacterium]|nr:hypothetical protein [Planctomycetia bacterium]
MRPRPRPTTRGANANTLEGALLLDTLLVLVLAAHLLAANIAGAAPLACLWLDWREVGRGDALAGELGRYLARQSLVWLSIGIALGAATLALVWLVDWQPFYEAARRIPASRYWWAGPELAVYYGCMWGCLRLWKTPAESTRWRVWPRRVLVLVAATNLMYHFPLLFTVIDVYSRRVGEAAGPLDFRAAILDPEVVSQVLHHLLASFAAVGIVMMAFAMRIERAGRPAGDVRRAASWGGRVALVPTALQLLVGLYVLVELPERSRASLLGDDALASILFGLSLVGAIMLLHRLAGVATGDVERRNLIACAALTLLVVVSMVGARHRAQRDVVAARQTHRPVFASVFENP